VLVHRDIKPDQFIQVASGRYKLNDFNLARWLVRPTNTKKLHGHCPFYRYYELDKVSRYWAPEEYHKPKQQPQPLTEKIDVYAFGNVLYALLHGHMPYHDLERVGAARLLMGGERPSIHPTLLESSDPMIAVLVNATLWCHTLDPRQRPTMMVVHLDLHSP
jgi:serine/threonine protein kinase